MEIAIFLVGAALVVIARVSERDFVKAFDGMMIVLGILLMIVALLRGSGIFP